MRIFQDSRKGKWVSAKDTVNFASPMNEVAADELGLLLKGHKIHGHNRRRFQIVVVVRLQAWRAHFQPTVTLSMIKAPAGS